MIPAVVPTYRPPADLPARLAVLAPQVSGVVVVDDGSPCTADPALRACAALPGVSVLRLPRNRGIAAAINVGLASLGGSSAAAVLTLDQDSAVDSAYVAALTEAWTRGLGAGLPLGALGAGVVDLGTTRLRYRTGPLAAGLERTDEVLQSGTLWSLDALRELGGFDESLVIDGVDTEMCLRLAEHGRIVAVAPGVVMRHSLGAAEPVRLLGREALATGHAPSRRYYVTRNRLRLLPRHLRVDPVAGLVAARRLTVNAALGLVRDGRPGATLAATAAGARDAALARTGPRP